MNNNEQKAEDRIKELEILLSEAQQWIDSEPDWKDKYNVRYMKLQDIIKVHEEFEKSLVISLQKWEKEIPYDSYSDALRDGLDHADAWGCFVNDLQEHLKKLVYMQSFREEK